MSQEDYYQVLGVDQNASETKIKEAYRRLAFKYHPDRNRDNTSAAEMMKKINEAYAVLSNPAKKSEYDNLKSQFGSSAYTHFRNNYSEQDIFSGSDINHIFEEMARSFGFRGSNEIFKEFYGRGYQRFEFKNPGGQTGRFIFRDFSKAGYQGQGHAPLKGNFGKLLAFSEKLSPLRRNVTTDEVGNAAAFLLSELASGITGEVTYVDAGFNIAGAAPFDD